MILFDPIILEGGEVGVLTGVGLVLIGRKDLPIAANALGKQVGRIVGLLQGARIRADRFATDHQLKQLQNEFKSGLRELDAVKAEMAGAMMSNRGLGGSNLGAIVPSVDKKKDVSTMMGSSSSATSISHHHMQQAPLNAPQISSIGEDYLAAAKSAEMAQSNPPISSVDDGGVMRELAPRSQSVAAVAEEEWEKQGIGFQSIAERGRYGSMPQQEQTGTLPTLSGGGSSILSNYLRQSLIYDQYERTVREQDDALRSRVEKVKKEVQRDRSSVNEDERKS